jgi:hypothetical protein
MRQMIRFAPSTPHTEPSPTRRTFVRHGAATMAMGVGPPAAAWFHPSGGRRLTDEQVAGFLQGFELALATLYELAVPRLAAGAPLLARFGSHHRRHAEAFAEVAGDEARPEANPAFMSEIGPELERAAVRGEADALALALRLEDKAAYTHAFALTVLRGARPAAVTATVLPVEARHATAIGLALGRPATEQFGTGAFEAAVVGSALAPGTGLDPDRYG